MPVTLTDILLSTDKITKEQADAFKKELETSGYDSEEGVLLKKLPEKVVFDAKSKFYGVPLKDDIDEDYVIPGAVLSVVPEEVSKTYKILPLYKEGSLLHIGMVNPQDIKASDAVKFILTSKNLNARIFLITSSKFDELFKQYSAIGAEVKEALEGFSDDISEKDVDEILDAEKDGEGLSEEAPVSKIVAVTFKHAFEGHASDIHIEPMEKETRVRFRIDGTLHSSLSLPKDIHSSVVSKIKILSNLKIDEMRVPQDGRFRTRINGSPVDFRVSTFPTVEGEKVVLRLLDPTVGVRSLEERGFVGYSFKAIQRALDKPFGMILTTGPTGSGKSTTLQSALSAINDEKVNIVSLEDPVEYYVGGVNQSQVRPDINYTFASGLRSILRQDPDVIMVGEIRDGETAALSVHAALTGHLVLSTLHTNDAIGVIPRLVDMGVEQFLLPSSLNIVIAQRLIRLLCNDCKKAVDPEPRAKEILDEIISGMPDFLQKELEKEEKKIYRAEGCVACRRKGTTGRTVIFEVLEMTPELKEIILTGGGESEIRKEAKRQNMITMRQDGLVKAFKGFVSLEEVLQSTVD